MRQCRTNRLPDQRWLSITRWLLMLLIAAGSIVNAQTSTGTIQGLIKDASGAVVPDAALVVTNVRTNEARRAITDHLGRYVVTYLLPGAYVVSAEREGFRSARSAEVVLNVGQNRSVDLTLEIGAVAQEMRVEAVPPPLDVNTSSVGQVIDNKRIVDLPLNGRSVFGLANLTPGVNPTGGGPTPQIGGGRSATSEILIDGVTTVFPSGNSGLADGAYEPQVDAVEEFNVLVNALSAEYGRFGGGVINLAMKSGTNELHGSAYNFLRNSTLDANNFFANKRGVPKGSFKRNQFGATIGGPVVVPGLYNGRDRTFFFFGIEGILPRQRSMYTRTVPSPTWRAGDFSGLKTSTGAAATIFDPLTVTQDPNNPTKYVRTPFPDNRIPANRLNPVAVNYMKFFPEANTAPVNQYTLSNNFVATGVPINDTYRFDPRVDHNWASWWRMFVRASFYNNERKGVMYFGNPATPGANGSDQRVQASLDHTLTINPTTVANLRYGLIYRAGVSAPLSDGYDLKSMGFPTYFDDLAAIQGREIPTMAFGGAASNLGGGGWNRYTPNAHSVQMFTGSVTKVFSNHTLKSGGEYRKAFVNQVGNLGYSAGNFSFSRAWTQQEISTSRTTEGFPLASFLLGLPSGGQIRHGHDPATSSTYVAGYVQDDWKVTPRLTLNLGLRYEIDFPRTERYNRLNYFLLNEASPIAGAVPGSACPSCANLRGAMHFADAKNRSQAPTDLNNWGPRIGLAYSLFPKTVLRAAYGIAYAPSALQAAAVGGDSSEAFRSVTDFVGSYDTMRTVNATLSDPFPNGFNFPAGPGGGPRTLLGLSTSEAVFDRHKSPYIQQWNFNIQQSLPGRTVLEIGYMGSRGIGLVDGDGGLTYNQLAASYMAMGSALLKMVDNPFYGVITNPLSPLSRPQVEYRQLIRPYPQYQDLQSFRKPISSSIYHAMTIRADKRFSNGVSFLVAYTAGKLIDDASAGADYLGPVFGSKLDAYNLRLEKAVSSIDLSQRLVVSYLYDLPFGRGRRFLSNMPKVAESFLGGWQFNGVTTVQGGTPVVVRPQSWNTYIYSGQRAQTTGEYAGLTGGTVDERLARWFDPSPFSQPASYTFGNVGRTIGNIRHPGVNTSDLSVFKSIGLLPDRRLSVQYRLEMFGAFNTPQWGRAGEIVEYGDFGVINGSWGERQIQMALKLIW